MILVGELCNYVILVIDMVLYILLSNIFIPGTLFNIGLLPWKGLKKVCPLLATMQPFQVNRLTGPWEGEKSNVRGVKGKAFDGHMRQCHLISNFLDCMSTNIPLPKYYIWLIFNYTHISVFSHCFYHVLVLVTPLGLYIHIKSVKISWHEANKRNSRHQNGFAWGNTEYLDRWG